MQNFNAVTESVYSPTNQEHLDQHKQLFGLASNEWAGFRQWIDAGRKVKKGAKGCKIYMVCEKKMESADSQDNNQNGDEAKKRQVVKSRYVFNKDHTEAL